VVVRSVSTETAARFHRYRKGLFFGYDHRKRTIVSYNSFPIRIVSDAKSCTFDAFKETARKILMISTAWQPAPSPCNS
jgi:hypothetical protein